ncbi:MAG: hypothetical protein HPY74_05955 [Firmicutes bacterium]|nr:hypothetical protein [Bacillota bacterium]
MKEKLDPRYILTGKDGELYAEDGTYLAQVNTFQAQVNITNTDYQPAGELLSVAVLVSYTVTLTFTETVIKDVVLLKKLMDGLKNKVQPQFGFQGKINGHDGTASRQIFRACVPDGSIDLANIQPGDIITRAWSFRVNEPPDLQELLGGAV